ncbi:hypothetical protein ACL02U_17040 [Streptomyces sp. MS06]|uniref:hypothetical protein n=1 Tax=Streptomyces sp. MS06 TaxID=3385974 RepID=UPI0039A0CBB6
MKLDWTDGGYAMELASPREHHLVRDSLVESAHLVDGLPDAECVARLGRTKTELQGAVDGWAEFRPRRRLSVAELELVRSCFQETLDFFSDAEYEMRTGWTREDSAQVLGSLMRDRRRITIDRQWGDPGNPSDGG